MSYTKSKITRIGNHEWDFWKVEERETNGTKGFEIHYSDEGECITDHVYTSEDAYLIASAPLLIETLKHLYECELILHGDLQLIKKAIDVANGKIY